MIGLVPPASGCHGFYAARTPVNLLHRRFHQHFGTAILDNVPSFLPHHARTFTRILKLMNQSLDYRLSRLRRFGFNRIPDQGEQREIFDPLGSPFRFNLVTGHTPYLLGISLKENLKQSLAETIDYPRLKVVLRLDLDGLCLDVTQSTSHRFEDTKTKQRIHRLERILEELATIINSRGAGSSDEID